MYTVVDKKIPLLNINFPTNIMRFYSGVKFLIASSLLFLALDNCSTLIKIFCLPVYNTERFPPISPLQMLKKHRKKGKIAV